MNIASAALLYVQTQVEIALPSLTSAAQENAVIY